MTILLPHVLDVLMFETHPMTHPLSKAQTLSDVGNMNLKLIVLVKLVDTGVSRGLLLIVTVSFDLLCLLR